jgi:hypothetical protein
MTSAKPHPCPGGCGTPVQRDKLACPICWVRLPKALRAEVLAAYRKRLAEPAAHMVVVARAYGWYRRNPQRHVIPRPAADGTRWPGGRNRHDGLLSRPITPNTRDGQ